MRKPRPIAETDPPTAFHDAHAAWRACPVSRRRFLKGTGALLSGLLLPWLPEGVRSGEEPPTDSLWLTLAAVQARLFPDDGNGPGAAAIHADTYLRRTMTLPRFPAAERDFILQGPHWLNELARQEHGRPFAALTNERQDALLTRIARSEAGDQWLSLLLLYIFEALLTAPVYGGNPGGIGWRWLEHNPGFPLPTAANTFDRILEK